MSKKITVLFDAENVTASFIPSILDFIQSEGDILIQRAYADWSFQGSKEWKSMLVRYPISAFQQFHHGEKQAVDKAIIMDAIELAIRHPEIDTFCIIASDAGYSPLALRLRELGKYVIGVGEREKTKKESSLFIKSYNEFKYTDQLNVVEPELKLTDDDKKDNNMDEFILAQFIEQAYNATPKNDGIVLQSRLVESIKQQQPDFDYHDYKYTAWNKMFEALGFSVELDTDGNTYRVIKQETEDEIFKEGEIFRIIGPYGIIKAENLDYFFYKGSLLPQFRNEKIKKGDKVRFQVAKKPDNEAQKNRDKNGKAINIEILKENEIS